MNNRISTDARFDDDRYWRFQRNSGLPVGYFDSWRITPDAIVVGVSLVCLVVALVVAL